MIQNNVSKKLKKRNKICYIIIIYKLIKKFLRLKKINIIKKLYDLLSIKL